MQNEADYYTKSVLKQKKPEDMIFHVIAANRTIISEAAHSEQEIIEATVQIQTSLVWLVQSCVE